MRSIARSGERRAKAKAVAVQILAVEVFAERQNLCYGAFSIDPSSGQPVFPGFAFGHPLRSGLAAEKIWKSKNPLAPPHNRLKSLKTAKGIFGKACRVQGKICKSLQKSLERLAGPDLRGGRRFRGDCHHFYERIFRERAALRYLSQLSRRFNSPGACSPPASALARARASNHIAGSAHRR